MFFRFCRSKYTFCLQRNFQTLCILVLSCGSSFIVLLFGLLSSDVLRFFCILNFCEKTYLIDCCSSETYYSQVSLTQEKWLLHAYQLPVSKLTSDQSCHAYIKGRLTVTDQRTVKVDVENNCGIMKTKSSRFPSPHHSSTNLDRLCCSTPKLAFSTKKRLHSQNWA